MNEVETLSIVCIDDGGCPCGISMRDCIRQIQASYPNLSFSIHASWTEEFSELVGKAELPATLILYNKEVIGKLKGFQPFEIVELWLDECLEKKGIELEQFR